jgi:methionyl-tRNA synthetase
MGKDIVRFHASYWPAFLMASGLPLPKHLLVHGWFKVGAQKMSKSLGNVIDPLELYKAYGADQVRYYLMRQMAITHDGEFGVDDLEQKITSDLADDLGNLLNRMVTLAQKYNLDQITPPQKWSSSAQALYEESLAMNNEFQVHMDEFMFHMALARLWRFINQVNAYFHAQEPWKIAQKDQEKFKEIISATAHALQIIALLLWPVMPRKMEQLLASLGVTLDLQKNNIEPLAHDTWNKTFMFKKIDNLFVKPIVESVPSATENTVVAKQEEIKDESISFDEFLKVHLVVGTIEQCEEIPQSDKLYKLQVNFGPLGMRQILSGVRKYFKPEELIGKQGTFVTNLKPRKMMGLESQGMMLTAEDGEKKLSVIAPNIQVPNGTKLK